MLVRPDQPIGRTAAVPFGSGPLMTGSANGDRIAFATVSVSGTIGTSVKARMCDSALARSDSGINRGSNPAMRLHTASRGVVWATETDADGFVSLVRLVPAGR